LQIIKMAKSIKKPGAFQIPSIEEVRAFMNLCKPDWPTAFVAYYSQRWLDHYMANGFVVGRVKMKDWHSCVRGQWLQLKFKEDKDRLEADLKSWTHQVMMDERRRKSAGLFAATEENVAPLVRVLQFLDGIFDEFKAGTATEARLRYAGEWLRKRNLLRLSNAQIDRIKAEQGNQGDYGLILAMRQFFTNLQAKGQTVAEYYYAKTQPSENSKTA
jgi:hypothetical protein